MMVQEPKRCGICSGVKSSRGLFLHLDLDAPVLCAAFEIIAASQDMSATAIRQWVRETAQRLEDELAGRAGHLHFGCQRDWDQLSDPAAPLSLESTAVMSMQRPTVTRRWMVRGDRA
jgi:hypothetical protein